MVLEGRPGTAKASFARIVAEILFGLGKIQRPEVMEVTEEDLVVGYVSQTAQRMKEVCEAALGGVLFIDEAYRLAPEHEGHSFGKDAINTMLKYMEDFRDQLVVIVAGYPVEMRRFLAANPGLASRFHFTLTFESYTPDEIVAIARHIAGKEKIAIAEQAWPLLEAEALRLRSLPTDSGTALDVAGNGRYARKVVIACNRERARRLHVMAPAELAELANTEPSVLVVNSDDLARALASALASEEPGRTAEIVQGTSTKLVHCRPRHESTSIPRHSSSLGWRGRAVVSPIAHGDASALPGRASELRTLCAVGAVARNRIGGAAGGTSSTSLRPSRRRGAVSSTEFGVAETVAA